MIIKPIKGSALLLIAPLMFTALFCWINLLSPETPQGWAHHHSLSLTHTCTHPHTQTWYAASTDLTLPWSSPPVDTVHLWWYAVIPEIHFPEIEWGVQSRKNTQLMAPNVISHLIVFNSKILNSWINIHSFHNFYYEMYDYLFLETSHI